jgi:hypothetical protein
VIDVQGNKDEEGRPVIVNNNNKGTNQKWKIIYLDQAKKTETSGLNEEFGFHINRPFYLVSELPMNRVAECIGANNIVIKRYAQGRSA